MGYVSSETMRVKIESSAINLLNLRNTKLSLVEDAEHTKMQAIRGGFDVVIVDRPGFSHDWEALARSDNYRLFAVDDRPTSFHEVDCLISCAAWSENGSPLRAFVPDGVDCIAGPGVFPIAQDFLNGHRARFPLFGERPTVGAFFGAVDPGNMLQKVLEVAAEFPEDLFEFSILTGDLNPSAPEIEEIASELPHVQTQRSRETMSDFWSECSIGIGSFGMSAWERCSLGLPTITSIQNPDQIEDAAYLTQVGAIVNLGPDEYVTSIDISDAISFLTSSKNRWEDMARTSLKVWEKESLKLGEFLEVLHGRGKEGSPPSGEGNR